MPPNPLVNDTTTSRETGQPLDISDLGMPSASTTSTTTGGSDHISKLRQRDENTNMNPMVSCSKGTRKQQHVGRAGGALGASDMGDESARRSLRHPISSSSTSPPAPRPQRLVGGTHSLSRSLGHGMAGIGSSSNNATPRRDYAQIENFQVMLTALRTQVQAQLEKIIGEFAQHSNAMRVDLLRHLDTTVEGLEDRLTSLVTCVEQRKDLSEAEAKRAFQQDVNTLKTQIRRHLTQHLAKIREVEQSVEVLNTVVERLREKQVELGDDTNIQPKVDEVC